jgi:citrate lyase beta subunit
MFVDGVLTIIRCHQDGISDVNDVTLHVFAGRHGPEGVLPVIDRIMADGAQSTIDALVRRGTKRVLLADCRGAGDLQRVDIALGVAEARSGRQAGSTAIVASIDSAAGLLQIAEIGGKSARLAGLSWNAARFAGEMRTALDGASVGHARIQVLVAARAFRLPAYDWPSEATDCVLEASRAFGFDGYRLD